MDKSAFSTKKDWPLSVSGGSLPWARMVAGAAGFEPATCGFGDRCSTSLSYAPDQDLPRDSITPVGSRSTRRASENMDAYGRYVACLQCGYFLIDREQAALRHLSPDQTNGDYQEPITNVPVALANSF